MLNSDPSLVTPQQTDLRYVDRYVDLEAQLLGAVADFGVDELTQMLDAAEAIRRTRRL